MGEISFWCKTCGDFDLPAVEKNNSLARWFEAECPVCKKKLIRYADDFKRDPYFRESRKVRMMRDRYKRDVIQYGQDGFQTFYRNQWLAFERQREEYEKNQMRKKKERDEFLKKHFRGSGNREAALHALDAEDKLT